jgi:AcrR family transcriptional regulator
VSAIPHRRRPRSDDQSPVREDGRAARARTTRVRIIAAATELFATAGYSATTIAAIAAGAGVSEQTVYYGFGTKRAVLTAAVDLAVAGDDEPVPTLHRPWVRAALAEPDPREQLRRQVAGAGEIYRRVAPLLEIVRSAAADPDLSELWAANVRQRLTVQRAFAASLAGKTPLRDGLTVDAAADIALAVLSPETYHLLVHQRGWAQKRWRAWATSALQHLLTTLP